MWGLIRINDIFQEIISTSPLCPLKLLLLPRGGGFPKKKKERAIMRFLTLKGSLLARPPRNLSRESAVQKG
jgi:hypothetical protein